MKQTLDTSAIRSKFLTLISLDEQGKQKQSEEQKKSPLKYLPSNTKTGPKPRPSQHHQSLQKEDLKQQFENRFKEVIYTKGDIVKQISKLKPYLMADKEELTTVQLENMESKKMSAEQKKSLSNVIIYLNKRLCQKLREQARLQKDFHSDRNKLQKEGWVYEVFYRKSQNTKEELSGTEFRSGYAILTSIVQLYQNLTFTNRLAQLNVSQFKRVKYTSEKQYQIIDIRYEGGTLQLGFLNETKLQLFDRMLFLLKNMARTSTKRLFTNQLIKSLYSEY